MNHPAIRPHAVAIVTGAAAGIGYAIALRLVREGMKVVLFDKDPGALDRAVASLYAEQATAQLLAVTGDVCSAHCLQELYERALGFGDITMVINNAAILKGAGPWQNEEQWRATMEVNFWSALNVQRKFVSYLLAKDSHAAIVNVGSKEGITTPPGNAAYSVSKAAIKVLTEQLAHELREQSAGRVSAHLLIPGFTFTAMNFRGMNVAMVKPEAAWTADQVAERMVQGMTRNEFYLFCEDNEVSRELDQHRMQWSADDLILNRPALSRWHPDYTERYRAFVADVKSPD
jgi:NAD(P)-dependent dehydrogenase (short-subunit alcohol dehydrogenase family)